MSANVRNKINDLLSIEGYSTPEAFLSVYAHDSVVPAICMSPICDSTYRYEPDCQDGWCDDCQKNTVKSGLVLLGII